MKWIYDSEELRHYPDEDTKFTIGIFPRDYGFILRMGGGDFNTILIKFNTLRDAKSVAELIEELSV